VVYKGYQRQTRHRQALAVGRLDNQKEHLMIFIGQNNHAVVVAQQQKLEELDRFAEGVNGDMFAGDRVIVLTDKDHQVFNRWRIPSKQIPNPVVYKGYQNLRNLIGLLKELMAICSQA
jgi:hypothetical protein